MERRNENQQKTKRWIRGTPHVQKEKVARRFQINVGIIQQKKKKAARERDERMRVTTRFLLLSRGSFHGVYPLTLSSIFFFFKRYLKEQRSSCESYVSVCVSVFVRLKFVVPSHP
jgi:hypothetical protein